MSNLEIAITVYGFFVLVILARNIVLCQRGRVEVKKMAGVDTTFTQYIPAIVKDALLFPVLILWHGLRDWLKDLE
jgi:hypothetical protein